MSEGSSSFTSRRIMSFEGGFFVCSVFLCWGLKIVSAGSFTVEVPQGQIVGRVGSTVTLPCWISPPQNAEALEIRWYRPDRYISPVLLYKDGKIQEVQEEQYRNRSSLTLRSAQSHGLKDGDVSLRLENLSIQDEGVFHCYVSGDALYEKEKVTLNITALGSTPLLFSQPVDDKHMNISCRSSGWFPQPSITWRSDRRSDLSAGGSSHSRGADGTFSVHSWTLVSPSDTEQIFCLLSVRGAEEREGGMEIQAISSSADPWKALFITILIAALLGLFGFILYKHRDKLTGKKTDEQSEKHQTAIHSHSVCNDDEGIKKLRKHAAVITLNRESASPALKISKDLKSVRDSTDYQRRGDEFPFELCVCGAQTFSSGRHYWEVELIDKTTDPKDFWLIGVMKAGNFRLTDKTSLTSSKGFWFLCSDGPKGLYTSTEPPISISPAQKLQCLGVLLDYDGGQLSFYDVTQCKHLLTMNTKFSGSVVPLFNPGVGDKCPLRIQDLPEPVESPVESSEPLLQETERSV